MTINIMTIFFFIVMAVFLALLRLSKGKYIDQIEPLDKKEHQLRGLYPIGFFIMEQINYKYSYKYDRRMLNRIAEIRGAKFSMYYLKVHWASKIAYVLFLLILLSLLGMAMEPDATFAGFCIMVLGLSFYLLDKKLIDEVNKRRIDMMMDFPDFINKLTLLINAGMTVMRAWELAVTSGSGKENTVLYKEVALVLSEIKSGKPEAQAYEDFAKRTKIPEIMKFISVIIQNLKKGNVELVTILKFQAKDCWEMRKNAAKRLGEEASTKMLLPMMIMFLAILIIVATPAILSLQGI